MSYEQAQSLIEESDEDLHFDYVNMIVPLKVVLSDDELDVSDYDRANGGEGAAEAALEQFDLL